MQELLTKLLMNVLAERQAAKLSTWGLALLTDDAVQGFAVVACSEEWAATAQYKWIPTEWPDYVNLPHEVVASLVAELADRTHAERFECLVGALEQLRAGTGKLRLCVTSTDPSAELEQLAKQALTRLNTSEVAALWTLELGF